MSRKQLIWIFASITFILAIVVLYQQYTIQSTNSSIKSVRQQTTTPTGDTSADMIEDIQAIAS
jgi:cell division protein FtsL